MRKHRKEVEPMISGKQQEEMVVEGLLTVREAAALLHVSPRTVFRMMDRGELAGIKLHWAWRFRRADIDSYLREHTINGQELYPRANTEGQSIIQRKSDSSNNHIQNET